MRVTAFCRIASLQSIHLRPLKALRQTCLFPGPRFCSTEYPRSSIGVIHHLFLRFFGRKGLYGVYLRFPFSL